MPSQVPSEVESVSPSTVPPVAAGAVRLAGGSSATTAVTAEAAAGEPPASLVATTRTRMREPTSAPVSGYVAPVAPGTSAQAAPAASQRCHWRA